VAGPKIATLPGIDRAGAVPPADLDGMGNARRSDMRDAILTAFILGLVPVVALGRADIGILLWFWISYMSPQHLSWGFAYDMPFALVVGLATLMGWLMSPERKRLPSSATSVLLIVFALWISITTQFAIAPDLATEKWSRTLKILLASILTLCIMGGRQRILWLVWVTTGSIAFYGVKGGLFAAATGGNFRVVGPPDSMLTDNNQAAVAFLMVLPLLRYLQIRAPKRWLRLAFLLAMVLTLIAILGSYSRGAVIGLSATGLVLWLRSRRKLVIAVAMAALAAGAVSMMPPKWFDRIRSTADYQDDSSTLGRFDAWNHAITVAVSRPLTGGGFGTFSYEAFAAYSPGVNWRAAHSIYFEVLGEQGFIGLAISVSLLLVSFHNCGWVMRRGRDRPGLRWAVDLAAMLQVSFVGYAVGGAFLSLGYFDLFYGLAVIAALTRLEVARALAGAKGSAGVAGEKPGAPARWPAGSRPTPAPSQRWASSDAARPGGLGQPGKTASPLAQPAVPYRSVQRLIGPS
jgi:probable O-glycosylation ligase (exosortase A-associated)